MIKEFTMFLELKLNELPENLSSIENEGWRLIILGIWLVSSWILWNNKSGRSCELTLLFSFGRTVYFVNAIISCDDCLRAFLLGVRELVSALILSTS